MKDEGKEFIANFIRDEFPKIYNVQESRRIWQGQSERFKQFWENRIMRSGPELSEDEMIPVIQILDIKGKRRNDEERKVQGAAFTNIYQSTWYRMFRELRVQDEIKSSVDRFLKSSSDAEQIELLNRINEANTDTLVPALTGENGIVLNAIVFAFNPDKNISVVSLSDRYRIIDFFELDEARNIGAMNWGEKIIFTRQKLFALNKKLGLNTDGRGIGIFLYSGEIKRLWRQRPTETVEKEKKTKVDVLGNLQTHAHLVGPPINFRDMDYGPTEENGVIFLFSKITNDLGIKMVSIQKHFPDAEAIKYGDDAKGYRVYIEFEYLSSDFIRHGHIDQMKKGKPCDLIVCWENDSKEIPKEIEVLELKEVIKRLPRETT